MTVRHLNRSSPLITLLCSLGLWVSSPSAQAVGTPAGTTIINVATGSFQPLTPLGPTTAQSNAVTTTVQAVCALSVTPNGTVAAPGQQATLLPGERATFPYTLINAGNAPATFAVLGEVVAGSAFQPEVSIHQDVNSNGVVDANEPPVTQMALPMDGRAQLLLLARTALSSRGAASVNLVGNCGQSGAADTNNISRVTVGPPPALGVTKTFSPVVVRPGTETLVTVTLTNQGQGDSRELLLTDLLGDQAGQGLTFVAGSAALTGAPAGTRLEYSPDEVTWQSAEPAPVRGVRVRTPAFPAGAQLTLTFRMLAGAAAEQRLIANVATAVTGEWVSSGRATADVRYQPGVALGPVGQPDAPEGTPADSQRQPFGVLGQPLCFDHTLKNTGDVRDAFTVTAAVLQGAARAEFRTPSGAPLGQPLTLDPAQTAAVRVCYVASQAGPLTVLLTATGTRGTSNQTRNLVDTIESRLPELVKSTSVASTVNVAAGDPVPYTLSVYNPYAHALTDVVVTDPVPGASDVVSASDGGVVTGAVGTQVVRWVLGTLQAGERRTLTLQTAVSRRAEDGTTLTNSFQLTSRELPLPVNSNAVVTPVWSARLVVVKDVSGRAATYGDRLTYTLRVRNLSPTADLLDVVITDQPAAGLRYIAGTTTLAGAPAADPAVVGAALQWRVATIPARGEVVLTYAMRVTPEAADPLVNTAEAVGRGLDRASRPVVSNQAQATLRLNLLQFAPLGDILGVVFLDRNQNGLYDAGIDTPVDRARLLLAGGRTALTDRDGRYHFTNVPYGPQAVRLDPNTTPYRPLHVPADGGLSGTQTVQVRGLTGVDFPLSPLTGAVQAERRTTLLAGPVWVEKVVTPIDGGYTVHLRVTSAVALEGVVLTDPLPRGATLTEGRNTLTGTLPAGETHLTYRFTGPAADQMVTTDPEVSWRN